MRIKQTNKSGNNFQMTTKQFNKIYKMCFIKQFT